jgi:hypothetical protein
MVDGDSDADLNRALPVDDFGNDTLLTVVERLERSRRYQHYILREAELDDVWRHVETALKVAEENADSGPRIESLRTLLGAVMAAHDLVADGDSISAATRLREVMH